MVYVAMDDTDMPGTRGTGQLARSFVATLVGLARVIGVSRHQLLRSPRVPMTKNNSSNVIHIIETDLSLEDLAGMAEDEMRRQFIPGSDPGLCVVREVTRGMSEFGQRAKVEWVTKEEAHASVAGSGAILRELGGTGGGVIGAAAGAALAASGNDGRFVAVGGIRELSGEVSVEDLLAAGVDEVRTLDGQPVASGRVSSAEKIRPEIVNHRPVVLVQPGAAGIWTAVRRD